MELKKLNKKGASVDALTREARGLVGFGIILGIGLFVLNEIYDALPSGSQAANSTNLTLFNIGKFATWTAIIVVVIVAGFVMKKFAETAS